MADLRKINASLLPAVCHLLTASEQCLLLQKQRKLQGLARFVGEVCVGIALFSDLPSILRVERLYVFPTYRREGVGSLLLHTLTQLASRSGKLLVVPFAAARQQDPIYQLIAKQQLAIVRQDAFEARVTREEAEQAAAFCRRLEKRNPAAARETLPLAQQRVVNLRAICDQIQSTYPAAADDIRTGNYRDDLSFCQVQHGTIAAFCLVGEDADGVCLQLLHTFSQNSASAMLAMAASIRAILADTAIPAIRMTVTSNSAKQILNKLCPSYELTQHIYTAYSVEAVPHTAQR